MAEEQEPVLETQTADDEVAAGEEQDPVTEQAVDEQQDGAENTEQQQDNSAEQAEEPSTEQQEDSPPAEDQEQNEAVEQEQEGQALVDDSQEQEDSPAAEQEPAEEQEESPDAEQGQEELPAADEQSPADEQTEDSPAAEQEQSPADEQEQSPAEGQEQSPADEQTEDQQAEESPAAEQTEEQEAEQAEEQNAEESPAAEQQEEEPAAAEQAEETQADDAAEPSAADNDDGQLDESQVDKADENVGEIENTAEDGLEVPPTDTKGQQTTPAQSQGAPTPHEGAAQEQEEQDEQQADDTEAQMEDKKTPEPPTEDIATGTEAGPGAEPAAAEQVEDQGAPPQPVETNVPSPTPQFDKDATATVKFVLLPTQQVATLRCYLTQALFDLKQHFAQELKIPASAILFMLDGKGTADRMSLGELGVGPNGTIRLEMQSADPENQPITAFKPRQDYTMPDVISVRVQSDGVMKDVVVEIERSTRKKPFLGGYRHKKTNAEYHHASAQTMQKPRPPPAVERFCRDTQTVKQQHIVQQTTNDMSTQMTKIGVYVSNMEDKLKVPGKYTTADDYLDNKLNKTVIIQKYYRRWLAKRYVEKVRNDQKEREEWERQEELRKKKEKEDRIRREFERRMNPKSKEDFDLLYHALEKWRQEEMNNINANYTGAERKAALCQLLDQETQLIASIGRHKLEADNENKEKQIQKFLDQASSAKKWRGPDGKMTQMDTPYTIRAQELKDIYSSINMKFLTQDERLDVLLTLKHTVKEHDCKLTQEIIELIDREADLLMRGVKESNLEGLRKRISTLFLQYIKTPTFNPEAARLLKVPQDPSTLRKNIYFCPSCNQYLPSTEFQLSSNSRVVGKCRKCNKIDNDARVRQDYSHYRFMLNGVRRSEESYGDASKIAYLMQESDLRYLVENVWNSQSILSAWDDLYDLVLIRWDVHEEWAPWNSILLTKEEASAHIKLDNLDEAYGKVFVHKVKHKHTLARNYFSRMPGMAEHMRSRNNSALPNGPTVSGKSLSITPTQA